MNAWCNALEMKSNALVCVCVFVWLYVITRSVCSYALCGTEFRYSERREEAERRSHRVDQDRQRQSRRSYCFLPTSWLVSSFDFVAITRSMLIKMISVAHVAINSASGDPSSLLPRQNLVQRREAVCLHNVQTGARTTERKHFFHSI